ncbi:MAG: hypothetical protein IKD79_07970, partial [Oscillospiraceae bacterium]|nr:hypothetical protein [Oscillospiraceae bacterium]
GTKLTKNSLDLKDDDVTVYSGAAEDDYVIVADKAYTVSGNTEITKADIVSGEVTSLKGDVTDARVNGSWYSVVDPTDTGDKINLNDAYDFALVNGWAFNADKTKGNISASNVLYVKDAAALTSGLSDGFEAKVYFADGTSQTVIVTEYNDVTLTNGDDADVIKGNSAYNAADDEIGAIPAAANAVGKLCTFSQKNGEYSLETVSDNNKGSYDNYTAVAGQIKDGKVAGNRFNADAVIFVKDNDGVKVVTGKTVTNWKAINANSVIGLADKSNGTNYYAIGAIDLGTQTAKTDARVYGFVTADNGISKEGSTEYRNFTMWDGTQNVEVKVENKSAVSALAKDRFVSFDWADQTTGEADKDDFIIVAASPVAAYSKGTDYAGAVAITAFVDGDSISFNDGTAVTTLDLADTYFVIGVDTNAREGVSGKLVTAKDAVKDTSLYRNAVVFVVKDGSDDVVEAVFVDVNGSLYTAKDGSEVSYVNKI